MKLLIVEDEPYIRKAIIKIITDFNKNITIIGECASVKEAVIVAKATKPDLVLLDINLQDGTGFKFLEQVEAINFKIIFITAYEEYALKALKNGALDYILKPIDEEELEIAINKALKTVNTDTSQQLEIVKEHINGNKDRIVLSLQDGYQIIQLKELVYCQSDAGYTTFHLSNNTKYVVSKPIKEFEKQLPSSHFMRTHQSYIVNINFVEKLDKTRYLLLKNNINIPVSIRKMDEIVTRIFK